MATATTDTVTVCRNCGVRFDAPEGPCPKPSPGVPYADCGRGGHWFVESPAVSGANGSQVGGSHYLKPIQPWDFITANRLGYLEGSVVKYVTRHRDKNGIEDLKKARHYLDKLIEVETARLANSKPQWETDAEP